jgi:hypothetical protein
VIYEEWSREARKTAIDRQLLDKHVSAATNTLAITDELLETMILMRFVTLLNDEEERGK